MQAGYFLLPLRSRPRFLDSDWLLMAGLERTDQPIRSFVLRQGRLSPGQRRALEEDLPRYEFCAEHENDPQSAFPSPQPLTVEIGFGNGESLLEMAADNPNQNFLGFEVHGPGVGHLVIGIKARGLSNLRVSQADAIPVISRFPAESLAKLQTFFPDPWHKKKHHKRRILKPAFLELAHRLLTPEGIVHVATDWAPYAEEIGILFSSDARYVGVDAPSRPPTKYERRGERLGHAIQDLAIKKAV